MVNKATLIGNVGNEPETKALQNGGKVANFSVATSEKFTDKAGVKQEKTEWHRIVCFGNVADIVEKYVRKGAQVFVEGKIQTREWEDKDKVKRYTTEILAQTIRLLGKKDGSSFSGGGDESASSGSESGSSSSKKAAPAKEKAQKQAAAPIVDIPGDDDDLPF